MLKRIILSLLWVMMFCSMASGELIENGDGTVSDTHTGLMWQIEKADRMPWSFALKYCENLTLAGHDDWRLPNRNELQSIVNYSKNSPAIETEIFADMAESPNKWLVFWTSTTYVDNTDEAWGVEFKDGTLDSYLKSNICFVRAVRNLN